MLFGAMIASGVLHGTGMLPGQLPNGMQFASQILIGAWSGSRFVGFDMAMFRRSLAAAAGSFAIAVAIAGAFAATTASLVGVEIGAALLAFAPGGLEAMTLLAFALGVDPVYVGAHHLARFLMISAALPVVMAIMARRRRTPGA